jgi:hypothetical protein
MQQQPEENIMFNSKTQLKTRLTCISKFNIDNVVFSESIIGTIGEANSKQQIRYRRVRYGIKNPNGSYGDLIMRHCRLYAFGIQESRDASRGDLTGYSIPLCMWDRSGASDDEKKFIEIINQITEKTKDFLLENKADIEKYKLERSDLKNLNPLYYKEEQGKIVETVCPKLYAKLIYSKKSDTILTSFYTPSGIKINPAELMDKHLYVTPAIKFESIFIGSKITIQVKITEAIVEMADSAKRSLLFDNEEEEEQE